MKKADLVQTTIIIIALMTGYSALGHVVGLLSMVSYIGDLYYMRDMAVQNTVYEFLMAVVFTAACLFLIKNSRKYAALILKDEPEGSWEDTARLQLDRQHVIFVLLIGMGLHTLIQSLPYLVSDLFDLYRNKVTDIEQYKVKKTGTATLVVELLRITLGMFLIYAAPAITHFINQRIAARMDSDL